MLGEHKWKKDDVSLILEGTFKRVRFRLCPEVSMWCIIYFLWFTLQEGSAKVECRYDWHQTASHVTVAIYGKKYDPDISKIEAHGIRLKVHVYFPEQAGAFDLDLELAGVSIYKFFKH